jgi:hypothetical protein
MGSVKRPPQLSLSLNIYVTFSGIWPFSVPLVHVTCFSSSASISFMDTDYVSVWITFQSSTPPYMNYTPGFTIKQLESAGEVSMTDSDQLTVNRLVIWANNHCSISLRSQVAMNTPEAAPDFVQREDTAVDIDLREDTVAKVINISGPGLLNAASSLTIAEGVIMCSKAPFSELPPAL